MTAIRNATAASLTLLLATASLLAAAPGHAAPVQSTLSAPATAGSVRLAPVQPAPTISVAKKTIRKKAKKTKKTKKWRVVFHANGGRIGSSTSKKVSITRKKRLGKLPRASRTGYTLQGWYTKRSGGSKISSKTKPKRNTTYYARWKKKSYGPVDAGLVGDWSNVGLSSASSFHFKADGGYTSLFLWESSVGADICRWFRGNWTASQGRLTRLNVESRKAENADCATANVAKIVWGPWSTEGVLTRSTMYYALGADPDYGNRRFMILEEQPITGDPAGYAGRYWRDGGVSEHPARVRARLRHVREWPRRSPHSFPEALPCLLRSTVLPISRSRSSSRSWRTRSRCRGSVRPICGSTRSRIAAS